MDEERLKQAFSGKKVLITGGLGFIGSNLARRLLKYEAKVSILERVGAERRNIQDIADKIEIIEGDFSKDIEKDIADKHYLFHLAWQTDLKKSMENPKEDLTDDIGNLIILLEACRKNNPQIKIVFSSTVTIISDCKNLPANEQEKENPLSVYDLNKFTAEKYLQMYWQIYGVKSCILRLSNVFGEGQRIDNPNRGVLNFMIGRALRNEPLTVYGDGEFIRDYCYIQNYIDAFLSAGASEKTNGEMYLLGSGRGLTFNDVVGKIKKIVENLTEIKVTIQHIPFPGDEHKINKRNFVADYSKFNNATGWVPKISFEDGLQQTIEYYYTKYFKA